ncbi:MAG: hypothetical protein KAS32_18005 [Candidatus Peribacteraceae bacterium]|nr:hypothetical protein [Candidatus Peribacteraceae bacterium]
MYPNLSNRKNKLNINPYSNLVLPLVQTVYPSQVAKSLVGVQPMSKPNGNPFFIKTKADIYREWRNMRDKLENKIKDTRIQMIIYFSLCIAAAILSIFMSMADQSRNFLRSLILLPGPVLCFIIGMHFFKYCRSLMAKLLIHNISEPEGE